MDVIDIARVVLGLAVLVGGGELLVRGASTLATRWGLSTLVIGLTVVALGTSAPELAVSVGAVLRGETDLAVGNVVGSNIVNVLLVLGLAAVVLPLAVKKQLVRFDVPALIVISVALLVFGLDGRLSTVDALVLLGMMVLHATMTVLVSRRESRAEQTLDIPAEKETATGHGVVICLLLVLGGIALLVAGSNVLVTGAVNIASALGVDGLIVGLTVLALGTSLPELATSLIAAVRGQRDLAVGNVVGSSIANIGFVLAVPALIAADGIPVPPAAIALDIPLMLAAAVAVLPVIFTGYVVQRWEGALFIGLYLAYTAFLILNATGHQALTGFTWVMILFVLPLVVLALASTVAYDLGRRSAHRHLPHPPG